MPATVGHSDVYVPETENRVRSIVPASTALTVFIGMADQGPFQKPTPVSGLAAYEKLFGAVSKGEMADQVRQYFINGGSEAWIYRIAQNARQAAVVLRDSVGGETLRLIARDPGAGGNMIRVEVDYATISPEQTFNLRVCRFVTRSDGSLAATDRETHANLSMDPTSLRYVPDILEASSHLIRATDLSAPLIGNMAVSIGGVIYSPDDTTARGTINALLDGAVINVQVGNSSPVPVAFGATPGEGDILAHISTTIQNQLATAGVVVPIAATIELYAGVGHVLQIASANGAIRLSSHDASAAAAEMALGMASGGVEIDSYSLRRPVPTGITSIPGSLTAPGHAWLNKVMDFGNAVRGDIASVTLTDPTMLPPLPAFPGLDGIAGDKIMKDPFQPAGTVGTLNAVRAALDKLAVVITADSMGRWNARREGLRLSLQPCFGTSNAGLDARISSGAGYDIGAMGHMFAITGNGQDASNVAAYSLGRISGSGGLGTRQQAQDTDEGQNGSKPDTAAYLAAFAVLESALPGFNIMVLPRADQQTDAERRQIWGYASASCAKRRAILLVDPDSNWTRVSDVGTGIDGFRIGIDTRNSAVWWPRLKVPQPGGALPKTIDPSGTIAGLMARNDSRFGVWRAPAGLEATLHGVVGLDVVINDTENGILNPRAVNAIRQFPSGVVSWGARMMVGFDESGNIDNKYVPVRRTMLFIEESLYRGLKFATFEPNAEPLWASIRLAADSFMNGLMRQGAFAGTNKREAYYVLCDETTTTENDRNLGIVNVIVGFAPLKPAEFVVLTIRQTTGRQEA